MIFIVNNQSLDDALREPNHNHHNGPSRNTASAKYKKINHHHNGVNNSTHQQNQIVSSSRGSGNKIHQTQSQQTNYSQQNSMNNNYNNGDVKNQKSEEEKNDYIKDILARLCAVLGFVFGGAGIGLLVFGILKNNIPCLASGAALLALGIVLGIVTIIIVYKMGGKTTSIKLRRQNKLRSRI